MEANKYLDQRDQVIVAATLAARNNIDGPRLGDFVIFPTGQLERFSNDCGTGLQTSPSGSFYLGPSGYGSFSGGLNPVTPRVALELMQTASVHGSFWFFHHGIAGAGRGVEFEAPCRVYKTSATYDGYLGSDFQSSKIDAIKAQLGLVVPLEVEQAPA